MKITSENRPPAPFLRGGADSRLSFLKKIDILRKKRFFEVNHNKM